MTNTIPSSEPSIVHGSFTIERSYPASPARVFGAFADQTSKRRWFVEGDGFEILDHSFDFQVGGRETSRFRFGSGPEMSYDGIYMDIIPDSRIVLAYSMMLESKPFSASLTTIQLTATEEGTTLIYTEHDAFFDGGDNAGSREKGCRELLEKLAIELRDHS